jgi:molecular chaperone DnaK
MVTLGSGRDALRVDLDRTRLSELIGDLLERTRACMERAVAAAQLSWPQLDSVLLVGGSSRITAVREMILDVTGKAVTLDVNPDEAVACGAAVRATLADLAEHKQVRGTDPAPVAPGDGPQGPPEVGIVVRDVATHSLGVRAFGEDGKPVNSIILPRFTELPCERKRTYATRADNQRQIEVEILQGDDPDPFSPEVESIGRIVINDLPPHPAGQVLVSLTLRYDVDGVVEVEAEELAGGTKLRQQLLRKSGELDPEVVQGLRRDLDALDALEPDPHPDPVPTIVNPYELLGVEPAAGEDELVAALDESEHYWQGRREEASEEEEIAVAQAGLDTIAEARAVLLDPTARAQLDRDLGVAAPDAPDHYRDADGDDNSDTETET